MLDGRCRVDGRHRGNRSEKAGSCAGADIRGCNVPEPVRRPTPQAAGHPARRPVRGCAPDRPQQAVRAWRAHPAPGQLMAARWSMRLLLPLPGPALRHWRGGAARHRAPDRQADHRRAWSPPRPSRRISVCPPCSSAHDIERAYLAVTRGRPPAARPGTVDQPPRAVASGDRKKMAVVRNPESRRSGRHAVTHYRTAGDVRHPREGHWPCPPRQPWSSAGSRPAAPTRSVCT